MTFNAPRAVVNRILEDERNPDVSEPADGKGGFAMLFAFFKRLKADQDGQGRIELMLTVQVVFAALFLS